MPVYKSEIIEQILQPSGKYRVKFKYTFSDDRRFVVGYITANDQSHIEQLLIDKKEPLELAIKTLDAEEAQVKGLKVAHKDATQADVYYAYLFLGYNIDDPLESYELIKPVAQQILNLGLTIEEMAELFNEDLDVAQGVFDRWAYLSSNEAEILAYKSVKDGL